MTGAFSNWCQLKRLPTLPAAPVAVAAFVADCHSLGAEQVWRALQEISQSHRELGYADPTAGAPVALAMNELSRIDPPRSWPKEERRRFFELPFDLQLHVVEHEAERDRAVKRALNAAASNRKGKAA